MLYAGEKNALRFLTLVFAALMLFGCARKNDPGRPRVYTNLNRGFEETLRYHNNYVYRLRVNITGAIEGKGEFYYGHSEYIDDPERYGPTILLEGEINETITHDWYTPEIFIKFIPENETVAGKITVHIEFNYSLDEQ